MTHVYAPVYQAVKTAQILENSLFEDVDFARAQVKLASLADEAYGRVRAAARGTRAGEGLAKKEAMAVGVADVVMSLYATHADTGTKVAALPSHVALILQKVAAAVLVDEVILEQLPMLEGSSKTAAEQCQLLGREYIMSLIGEVLA